ncbi:hypothetical protein HDU96_000443 [Phlyctochytrium bullatum]|nr:hypothetical protein HDU96_000443 [Phlyctochytrium bullatum]
MNLLKTLALAATLPALATAQKLVFSTPTLTLDDAAFGASLSLSLSEPPADTATVYLEAPGLQLTTCAIKFTRDDWRTPKPVHVLAGGSAKSTSFTIGAQVFAPGSGVHLVKGEVKVTRRAREAATCYSSGDPHYKTFDGKYYSQQDAGQFYLLRTPTFIVQADQQACADGVTCNRAIAVQFGSQAVVITADGSSTSTLVLKPISRAIDTLTPTLNAEKNTAQLHLPDGSQVTVSIYPWNGVYYMDATINLAGGQWGKTDGFCGSYNDNANDDGSDAGKYRVPADASLFAGKLAALTTQVPPATKTCKMPALGGSTPPTSDGSTPLPPGWAIAAVPSADVITTYIEDATSYAAKRLQTQLTAGLKIPASQAQTFCTAITSDIDSWCLSNVDASYFIGACTADVINCGDMELVARYRKSFYNACAAKACHQGRFLANAGEGAALLGKGLGLFVQADKLTEEIQKVVGGQIGAAVKATSFQQGMPQIQVPMVQVPQMQNIVPPNVVNLPLQMPQVQQQPAAAFKMPNVPQVPQVHVPVAGNYWFRW